MAVALEELYQEIEPLYDVRLVTDNCFHKIIEWTHIVEEPEFTSLLHGNELIFSVGIQRTSDAWLMEFIRRLIRADAGGLLMCLRKGEEFSEEVIRYCNQNHFPLFRAAWDVPFLDIMRLFASILLKNEQRETNLNTAFKNAIYYPDNEEAYIPHFERNGFFRNLNYVVLVLSCNAYQTESGNQRLQKLAKELHYSLERGIVTEEGDRLLILAQGYDQDTVKKEVVNLCESDPQVYVGMGTEVYRLQDLKDSYENAIAAYQLTKTAIPTNHLFYDELGIYKLLSDLKHPGLGAHFIGEVLGSLLEYDERNGTDYLDILECFFEHDCSILHTSEALYCHKNTLNYKMNKVKEILDYDIMSNENRTRIMVAFYFMKMLK